jgi:ubiquitin C-terminal hydrolase
MQRIGLKITLTVSDLQKEYLLEISERYNITMAQAARTFLDFGMDAYEENIDWYKSAFIKSAKRNIERMR